MASTFWNDDGSSEFLPADRRLQFGLTGALIIVWTLIISFLVVALPHLSHPPDAEHTDTCSIIIIGLVLFSNISFGLATTTTACYDNNNNISSISPVDTPPKYVSICSGQFQNGCLPRAHISNVCVGGWLCYNPPHIINNNNNPSYPVYTINIFPSDTHPIYRNFLQPKTKFVLFSSTPILPPNRFND